jgi:hypothetical protein
MDVEMGICSEKDRCVVSSTCAMRELAMEE